MEKKERLWLMLAGLCAGAANGLFGAGGGMLLVPLLTFAAIGEDQIFPCSVSVILPLTLVTLIIRWQETPVDLMAAVPYLPGSLAGGLAAGLWGKRIPVKWLHRALGVLILWGGVRYLC